MLPRGVTAASADGAAAGERKRARDEDRTADTVGGAGEDDDAAADRESGVAASCWRSGDFPGVRTAGDRLTAA